MKQPWAVLVAVALLAGCTNGHYTARQIAAPSATPSPTVSWTWPPTTACGHERWSVKTGTDQDAGLVNLGTVVQATVAGLGGITPPATPPDNARVRPVETTVYQVQATLTGFKEEADSDYHLILADAQGHTMIAEIPDPACVSKTSPLLPGIEVARSQFDARFQASRTHFAQVNVPVTVTGVGFFDFDHGQDGVAPNAIELHPVLGIEFT